MVFIAERSSPDMRQHQDIVFPRRIHADSHNAVKMAALGMTLREYRSLTLPIYFPCNNDTREVPSTFAALLFFMRRTTPLNPTT